MSMIVYTKRGCPWCVDLVGYLNTHDITFEEREVLGNKKYFEEMMRLSGQSKAPTVVVDDEVLADTDKYKLEEFLDNNK